MDSYGIGHDRFIRSAEQFEKWNKKWKENTVWTLLLFQKSFLLNALAKTMMTTSDALLSGCDSNESTASVHRL